VIAQLFPQFLNKREITKCLHTTHEVPLFIPQGRCAYAYGNSFSLCRHDVHLLIDYGLTCFESPAKGAVAFANVCAKDLTTRPADCFPASDPGDFFGCLIEGCNDPVMVHREDAVVNTVQDRFSDFVILPGPIAAHYSPPFKIPSFMPITYH
jgi:hypothetical protein